MTCKTDKAAVLHCENSRTMAMVPVIIVIVSWASVNTCAVRAIREVTTESKGCKSQWRVYTVIQLLYASGYGSHMCQQTPHCTLHLQRGRAVLATVQQSCLAGFATHLTRLHLVYQFYLNAEHTLYSLKTSPLPVLPAPSMPMFPMTSREGTLSLCQVLM